jgi:hypothetical protein
MQTRSQMDTAELTIRVGVIVVAIDVCEGIITMRRTHNMFQTSRLLLHHFLVVLMMVGALDHIGMLTVFAFRYYLQ